MTQSNTYNGWHNYETWLVALWLDNDQSLQKSCYNFARSQGDAYTVGEMIETLIDGINPLNGSNNLFSDMLNASLREVDWTEIGQHYVDFLKEGEI